jgi:hypothetical protein
MMLTVEEVLRRVKAIRDIAEDDESAHIAEDSLYEDVLTAIATGKCLGPEACARAALKTKALRFSRWCS